MIKLKRLLKSFKYAIRGFMRTMKEEQNLKVQVLIGIFVMGLAFYYQISRIEWCFLIFTIGLVLLMEIANSAIERISDVLRPRIHSYVMEVKDIMAAAVMLASIVAVLVGSIIFWPYIFH